MQLTFRFVFLGYFVWLYVSFFRKTEILYCKSKYSEINDDINWLQNICVSFFFTVPFFIMNQLGFSIFASKL